MLKNSILIIFLLMFLCIIHKFAILIKANRTCKKHAKIINYNIKRNYLKKQRNLWLCIILINDQIKKALSNVTLQ